MSGGIKMNKYLFIENQKLGERVNTVYANNEDEAKKSIEKRFPQWTYHEIYILLNKGDN